MEGMREGTDHFEIIDIYCHILPPKYKDAIFEIIAKDSYYYEADKARPALFDINLRIEMLDRIKGMKQVLTPGAPPLEYVASVDKAKDLARLANDEMAEIVGRYPDYFAGAVACLPLNDIDATLEEIDRAIGELKFKGIQLFTSINGKPLDSPEFYPIYEKMASYDLPIWIHPARDRNVPDYPTEESSKYALFLVFSWPYETTIAMARLVFSGILEKYGDLKFITHHCGGMLPSFYKRVKLVPPGIKTGEVMPLKREPIEYFRKFYADTVMGGNVAGLNAGLSFFGSDNLVFASDYPYPGGPTGGEKAVMENIESIKAMDISDEDKAKIFSGNAKRILKI
ncbi:MAG: amidohydrolase [Syntrophorhabdaceae bacterium]|nr:amidohydrolase [Syntrophorhabdaceae bacterium]